MRIALLGSTGSIGCNTLQVVREMRGPLEVVALTAGSNVERLVEQAAEFRPQLISLASEVARERFREQLAAQPALDGYRPEILCGPAGNLAAVTEMEADTVVSAAVGVAGLEATFEAIRRGLRVALANKEVLVAAGRLVMAEARRSGAQLLPVDSEHNGVHQCLRAGRREEVERLVLTASGGPFRLTPKHEMERVTPEQALRHPTWKMGSRITIDSATLMNKGFEVIEACWLFDFPADEVEVLVHPQSIVHALIEFRDGSVIAQLAAPDMKLPIRYALSYPEREAAPRDRRLGWSHMRQLDFEEPDLEKFPLLATAFDTIRSGGDSGCILNAADEIAVEAFLTGEIPFPAISAVVQETLERLSPPPMETMSDILAVDQNARVVAREQVSRYAARVG